ncbi:plasmid partitioning protein RepA, partial [Rhizobium ruizarguesonis]
KQTLYEIEKGQVRRSTYDRALESVNAANSEVLAGIHKAWGRA